jgi:hypothetical protein
MSQIMCQYWTLVVMISAVFICTWGTIGSGEVDGSLIAGFMSKSSFLS